MEKPVTITSLSAEELALLLSRASRKNISGHDVQTIAAKAGIVSTSGTISLIEYAAFLAREVTVREN